MAEAEESGAGDGRDIAIGNRTGSSAVLVATSAAVAISSAVALLGLFYRVRFEPTDELEYRAEQGTLLLLSAAPILALGVAWLVTRRQARERPPVRHMLVAFAAVAAIVPSVAGAVVYQRLHPALGSAFSSFEPPRGAKDVSTRTDASSGQESAIRLWELEGDVAPLCDETIRAVTAWASPASVVVEADDGQRCRLRATRDGARIEAHLTGPNEDVPDPLLSVTIVRERRPAG